VQASGSRHTGVSSYAPRRAHLPHATTLRYYLEPTTGMRLSDVSRALAFLGANVVRPLNRGLTHPFWIFSWEDASINEILPCSCVLLFAGILCSAAGIGGGGIYVVVLMVCGRLSPHNAVPLSKAVVFFGSVSSLVVNMKHAMRPESDRKRNCVIDTDACRVVVPSTLIGTYFGVVLNSHTSDQLLVIVLSLLLCFMVVMVGQTAMKQRAEELALAAGMLSADSRPTVALLGHKNGNKDLRQESEPAGRESLTAHQDGPFLLPSGSPPLPTEQVDWFQIRSKSKIAPGLEDAVKAGMLLFIVVTGGIFSFHMNRCRAERRGDIAQWGACAHPINGLFGKTLLGENRMSAWMSGSFVSVLLPFFVWGVPICTCAAMAFCSGLRAISLGWAPPRTVAVYQAVSVMTGVFAGLVGVGGGLILSPFFLITGMEPSVAVGTSATCVLFTSASTSLQYIFTDRIIMSLALVYGVATTIASWLGTSLVHIVQERFGGGKSYITMIVAVSVALSAVLSLVKFAYLTKDGQASAPIPPEVMDLAAAG